MKWHSVVLICLVSAVLAGANQVECPSWSYNPKHSNGPAHWGSLCPAYSVCGTGREQSPIDLSRATAVEAREDNPLVQSYTMAEGMLINSGHTIQVNFPPGNYISNGPLDEPFELQQAHFHSPSEHSVDDRFKALEIHLVHMNPNGSLVVVALGFGHGRKSALLAKVIEALPDVAQPGNSTNIVFDLQSALPDLRHYFYYRGSLTTPPCTEGVQWFVSEELLEASHEQFAALHAHARHIARPSQALNGREVMRYTVVKPRPQSMTKKLPKATLLVYGIGVICMLLMCMCCVCYVRQRRMYKELGEYEDLSAEGEAQYGVQSHTTSSSAHRPLAASSTTSYGAL